MNIPVEGFITWTSLGTIAGASAAILVVSNTIRKIFGIRSPIVPFAVALIITFGGAYKAAGSLPNFYDCGLAFLNSCLLFCTATGGQEVIVDIKTTKPEGKPERHGKKKIKWFSSWLRD